MIRQERFGLFDGLSNWCFARKLSAERCGQGLGSIYLIGSFAFIGIDSGVRFYRSTFYHQYREQAAIPSRTYIVAYISFRKQNKREEEDDALTYRFLNDNIYSRFITTMNFFDGRCPVMVYRTWIVGWEFVFIFEVSYSTLK